MFNVCLSLFLSLRKKMIVNKWLFECFVGECEYKFKEEVMMSKVKVKINKKSYVELFVVYKV